MSRRTRRNDTPLYFGHGDVRPDATPRELRLAELECAAPMAPPSRRPVGKDDDLGLDRFQVDYFLRNMT